MAGLLRGVACFAGIAILWIACQVNLALSVIFLLVLAGAATWLYLTMRNDRTSDHLYGEPPTITQIRGRQTPQRYTFERSNLDAPFFDLESRNYGKITPRRRVRGIPIDRFLEFQEKIDSLSEQLTGLLEKFQAAGSTADDPKAQPQTAATSESTTYSDAQKKSKQSKPRFKNDSKSPKPATYPTFTPPAEDKGILRRFKKSQAGDPWDSPRHWGWRS